jgi:phosphatidylinositol glycan class M
MSGKRYTAPSKRRAANTSTTRGIQLAAFVLQLCLIAYGEWHDRRNVVKYTDVDYRVFSDAVRALWAPDGERGNVARGVLVRWFGWTIGE